MSDEVKKKMGGLEKKIEQVLRELNKANELMETVQKLLKNSRTAMITILEIEREINKKIVDGDDVKE